MILPGKSTINVPVVYLQTENYMNCLSTSQLGDADYGERGGGEGARDGGVIV
jgi:hypothetical protein